MKSLKQIVRIGRTPTDIPIPGIAHFFEHLPFNITANFKDGEIFKFFQDRGGYLNAFTAYDATIYHGEVQKDHFKDGIRGIAELVCNPVFEEKRIADEAKTIVTEWAMRQGMQGIQRYARNRRASLGTNDPNEVIGTPDSIQSIKQENVVDFYQRHYTSDNLIVYMQGNMDPTQLLEEGIKHFSLPRGIRTELPSIYAFQPSTLPVGIPDAAATHATLLFPGLPFGAPPTIDQTAKICGQMICSIEGDLLKEARFDKRLVYGMGNNGDHTLSWGFEGIEFDAFPDKVPEVCEIVMRHLGRLASDPDQSLFESIRRNKKIGIGEFLRNNREQDPKEEVKRIRASSIIHPMDAYLNALTSITPQDVAAYAARQLVEGPISVVYEGKVGSDFPDNEALAVMRTSSTPPARTKEMDNRVQEIGMPVPKHGPEVK